MPIDASRLVSATNSYIELGMEISKASLRDYAIALLPTVAQTTNVSVSYERGYCLVRFFMLDKSAYKDIQMERLPVETPTDLREGTLLMNYPTIVLRKETYRLLPHDFVLLVTKVNEFGVKGLILNP